eukprot:650906-Pleurochrysis_carterae.AAC.3
MISVDLDVPLSVLLELLECRFPRDAALRRHLHDAQRQEWHNVNYKFRPRYVSSLARKSRQTLPRVLWRRATIGLVAPTREHESVCGASEKCWGRRARESRGAFVLCRGVGKTKQVRTLKGMRAHWGPFRRLWVARAQARESYAQLIWPIVRKVK